MPNAADGRRASSVSGPRWRARVLACVAACAVLSTKGTPADQFTFTKIDEVLLETAHAAQAEWDRHGTIFHDDRLTAYLTGIANPLLPREPLERVTWRLGVLRDSMVNALAFPDGAIYLNSGMLALLQTEDQLAAVLGHEIAHVTERHMYLYNRQYRKKSLAKNVILIAGNAALRTGGAWTYTGWGASVVMVSTIVPWALDVSVEGYGRDNERAADIRGLEQLELRGYDPLAMQQTFVLMRDQLDDPPVANYHGDHPALDERIRTTKRPAVALEGVADVARRDRFAAAMAGVKRHNVSLAIAAGRFRTAALDAHALLARERSPDLLCLLGDVHREAGPYLAEPRRPDSRQPKSRRPPKRTAEEEKARLLRTKEGRAVWEANFKRAEGLYVEAGTIAPNYPDAARGLGSLYEQAGDAARSVREYRRYLELAGDAPDRRRIELRIERLARTLPSR